MTHVWKTKWRWHTGYSADSVEWCPFEGYRDILVCGTYQLDKKDEVVQTTKQKRLGKIYLFVITKNTIELSPIQTVDIAGVLDQKWCYHLIQNHPVLAVVTSEGYLQLYKLVKEEELYKLELWISLILGQDILALSVDWSTNKIQSDKVCLVVSDSSGHVVMLKIGDDGLEKVGVWKAHDYEAWIAAFDYWNPAVFYSGGDDCLFNSYDMRVPEVPVSVNRSHEAGVTAIRSHVEVEHQLLTGSYDEKVRLWDARSLKRCITEKDVKGGVWRLKWFPYQASDNPSINTKVLAACMYGGFRILDVKEERIDVLSEYLEHESIAYGIDCKNSIESIVATCSFYDCKLHLSEIVFNC